MTEETNLQQNLEEKAAYSGVYTISLLFREQVNMPPYERIAEKAKEKFRHIETVSKTGLISFALTEHTVDYADAKQFPVNIIISDIEKTKEPPVDALTRTQFWDVKNGAELLDACPYHILLGDFMAKGLPPIERANILADWLDAALLLFPQCAAIYFQPSGKLLSAEQWRNNPNKGNCRFLYGAVNARFFNVQGTSDMLIDTLGLYAFGLPDVQYHFHTLDPNLVVQHAYDTAFYQFENNAPIESGHTVAGIPDSEKWKCRYEDALIQPVREVLDIAAGKYAAGER